MFSAAQCPITCVLVIFVVGCWSNAQNKNDGAAADPKHISAPEQHKQDRNYDLQPGVDPKHPNDIVPVPLSLWNEYDDTFEHADQSIYNDLATWIGMPPQEVAAALKRRIDCLQELSQDRSVDTNQMYDAINKLRECEKQNRP